MRIFLSYARDDSLIVAKFAERLEAEGYDVFFDASDLQLGASFSAALSEEINSADIVIFFLSKKALESSWFNRELGIAVSNRYSELQTRIIPIILDKEVQAPFFLSDYVCLDLSSAESESDFDEKISSLVSSLKKIEIKGAPETDLMQRQREIELERQFLLVKKIQQEELEKHRARQLFFLTTIAALFSMTGVIIFLLTSFANVRFEEFGWLLSTLLGAASAMIGSYLYMRKEEPEKRRLESLLADLERRLIKGGLDE
ncbi:toll/interleukin-1 receptor domain-containing protein [Duganella sp. Dugasp56]|uniref:toll/interleukin-1 receptor domain-containing protein n=1 Tax=Duganella sp. Dugasp56 TaxID=3243046 RepID=UPI0039AF0CB6